MKIDDIPNSKNDSPNDTIILDVKVHYANENPIQNTKDLGCLKS